MYMDNMGVCHIDDGTSICARCGKHSSSYIMSWFNTQMICNRCRDFELKDPRIKEAKEAEKQACLNGNYNYSGIGW